MNETYTLVLAKEDFKFSSAHFTLFCADHAERFHGHNYHVQVEIEGTELDAEGLLVGFAEVKTEIRALCRKYDSRTLIPTESPHLTLRQDESNVTVNFLERVYSFPSEDVELLPLVNTSIELLAKYLWQQLVVKLTPVLEGRDIGILGVNVGETAGQSCWYRAPFKR